MIIKIKYQMEKFYFDDDSSHFNYDATLLKHQRTGLDEVNDQESNSIHFFYNTLPLPQNQMEEIGQEFFNNSQPSLPKEFQQMMNFVPRQEPHPSSMTKDRKKKKNSNVIKKIGRTILAYIEEFKINGVLNPGAQKMMNMLQKKMVDNKIKDMVDGFNFEHLKALFNECSEDICSFNLRKTRLLFNKNLRKDVLQSIQIKGKNKLLYLKTLKCSSLRFRNKELALRLQNSESQ